LSGPLPCFPPLPRAQPGSAQPRANPHEAPAGARASGLCEDAVSRAAEPIGRQVCAGSAKQSFALPLQSQWSQPALASPRTSGSLRTRHDPLDHDTTTAASAV